MSKNPYQTNKYDLSGYVIRLNSKELMQLLMFITGIDQS